MGIKNLLKELRPALDINFNMSHLKPGTVIAIDGNGWLHKACYGAATWLALNDPRAAGTYLKWITRRLDLLLHHRLRPIVCFDGRRPSLKKETGDSRRERRSEQQELGFSKWRRAQQMPRQSPGRAQLEREAGDHFAKAVQVKFFPVVTTVLARLRDRGIPYIVAPFEADAQLAALCRLGLADEIITEDSDVAVYLAISGAKAGIIFKMQDSGAGQRLAMGQDTPWANAQRDPPPALAPPLPEAPSASGTHDGGKGTAVPCTPTRSHRAHSLAAMSPLSPSGSWSQVMRAVGGRGRNVGTKGRASLDSGSESALRAPAVSLLLSYPTHGMLPVSPARARAGAQAGTKDSKPVASASHSGAGADAMVSGGAPSKASQQKRGHLAGSSKFLRLLSRFTARQFLQVCILSGCDYIDSLPGVGTASAAEYVWRFRDTPDDRRVLKVVAAVRLKAAGGLGNKRKRKVVDIPVDYEMRFRMAESCFLHHVVYDPKAQVAAFLTPVPSRTQAIMLTPLRPQHPLNLDGVPAGTNTQHPVALAAATATTQSLPPTSAAASAGVPGSGRGLRGILDAAVSPVSGPAEGDGSSYLSTPQTSSKQPGIGTSSAGPISAMLMGSLSSSSTRKASGLFRAGKDILPKQLFSEQGPDAMGQSEDGDPTAVTALGQPLDSSSMLDDVESVCEREEENGAAVGARDNDPTMSQDNDPAMSRTSSGGCNRPNIAAEVEPVSASEAAQARSVSSEGVAGETTGKSSDSRDIQSIPPGLEGSASRRRRSRRGAAAAARVRLAEGGAGHNPAGHAPVSPIKTVEQTVSASGKTGIDALAADQTKCLNGSSKGNSGSAGESETASASQSDGETGAGSGTKRRRSDGSRGSISSFFARSNNSTAGTYEADGATSIKPGFGIYDASGSQQSSMYSLMQTKAREEMKTLATSSRRLIAESSSHSGNACATQSSAGVSLSASSDGINSGKYLASTPNILGASGAEDNSIATIAELVRAAFGRDFADSVMATRVAAGDVHPQTMSVIQYPVELRGKVPPMPGAPSLSSPFSKAAASAPAQARASFIAGRSIFKAASSPIRPTAAVAAGTAAGSTSIHDAAHRQRESSKAGACRPLLAAPAAAAGAGSESTPVSAIYVDDDEHEVDDDDGGFAAMLAGSRPPQGGASKEHGAAGYASAQQAIQGTNNAGSTLGIWATAAAESPGQGGASALPRVAGGMQAAMRAARARQQLEDKDEDEDQDEDDEKSEEEEEQQRESRTQASGSDSEVQDLTGDDDDEGLGSGSGTTGGLHLEIPGAAVVGRSASARGRGRGPAGPVGLARRKRMGMGPGSGNIRGKPVNLGGVSARGTLFSFGMSRSIVRGAKSKGQGDGGEGGGAASRRRPSVGLRKSQVAAVGKIDQ